MYSLTKKGKFPGYLPKNKGKEKSCGKKNRSRNMMIIRNYDRNCW